MTRSLCSIFYKTKSITTFWDDNKACDYFCIKNILFYYCAGVGGADGDVHRAVMAVASFSVFKQLSLSVGLQNDK